MTAARCMRAHQRPPTPQAEAGDAVGTSRFLVGYGEVVARFRPRTEPRCTEVVGPLRPRCGNGPHSIDSGRRLTQQVERSNGRHVWWLT